VEANSTGGQGSRRAVAPSDDDDKDGRYTCFYLFSNYDVLLTSKFCLVLILHIRCVS
jgi:hypothetical protein